MKLITAVSVLVLIFQLHHARAEALLTGNLNSVNPASGFNALRNPALMSWQGDGTISMIYIYSYLSEASIEMNLNLSGVKYPYDASFSEKYNGAVVLSDVHRMGNSSLGIGISKTGDGQFVQSESEYSFLGSSSSDEERYIGSTLYLSYSYRVSRRDSFGVQIDIKGSSESNEKSSSDGTNFSHLESKKNTIVSGISFGYSVVDDDFNFGAVVKIGRYGLENLKYDLEYNGIASDRDIPNYFMTDESASVLLGFGFNPRRDVVVSFEGGCLTPYTKKEKRCDDSLIQSTNIIRVKYTAVLRSGVSYRIGRNIELDFGGGYVMYRAESRDSGNTYSGRLDFSIFQLNTGIDLRVSDSLNILLGLGYNMIKMESDADYSLYAVEMNIEQSKLEVSAGAALKY